MAFRKGYASKRRHTRKLSSKKNRTKKRRIRGGVSVNLQNQISQYNVSCRVKNRFTGKFVDKRGDTKCKAWKNSLEEQYKQERPDRAQIEQDYGVDTNIEINDTITKPKKRWTPW
jgi:hypothetical protein